MTLTAALRAALDPATHPSNLTPLRQIAAHHEHGSWWRTGVDPAAKVGAVYSGK